MQKAEDLNLTGIPGPDGLVDLKRRGVTLKQVAVVAGVDPSVVSRVANADPALNISDETRARVIEAIESLGYRANQAARNLRLSRNFTLGLFLPDVSNPVYAPIVRGVIQESGAKGYAVVLGSEYGSSDAVRSFARLLDDGLVDGILVATGAANDAEVERGLMKDERIVLVNRRSRGASASAFVDDVSGSALATQHLINLGHRRIGHLAGPTGVETSRRRYDGYARALKDAHLRVSHSLVVELSGWSVQAGYVAARALLTLPDRPTAIFAANLGAAIGAMKAANELQISIPDQLSLIAFHDSDLAEFVTPPLTTVRMPLFELGRAAAKLLINRIEGREVPVELKIDGIGELRLRRSTAPITHQL